MTPAARPFSPERRSNARLALCILMLAGVFVRMWHLRDYYYNGDEMQFLLIAKAGSLRELWRRHLAETHPPLIHLIRYCLLHLSQDVFVQRLFSVAAGIITIGVMYRAGSALHGAVFGVACALCTMASPIEVSSSMSIRNYAPFLLALAFALFFFARYQQAERWRDRIGFAVSVFLASALHFSGFLAAMVFCLHELARAVKSRRWKSLWYFCVSLFPLLLLGVFLYITTLMPGTQGHLWREMEIQKGILASGFSAAAAERTIGPILGSFVPFPEIVAELPHGLQMLALAGILGIVILYALGFYRLYREAPKAFALAVTGWAVAIGASLAGIYPFSIGRHDAYFLPFFILPLCAALEPALYRIFKTRFATAAVFLLVAFAAVQTAISGYYLNYSNEFSLRRNDYDDAQTFLNAFVQPGDAIVTGRIAAYYYLIDAKDGGATPYDSYTDTPYRGATILAPYDPPFKVYSSWRVFHDTLAARLTEPAFGKGSVWFVSYSFKNAEIWALEQCGIAQPGMEHFFSRDGVLIFSIKTPALRRLLADEAGWQACYKDYQPVIMAERFPALPAPH